MPEELTPEEARQQCLFCSIIAGDIAAKKVYEDDKTIAILDINPASPGHVLVLPKEHYAIMPQMPDEVIGYLGQVAKALSLSMLKALKSEGTTFFIANGPAAGQRAQHFMLHIIPRNPNDGVGVIIPEGKLLNEQQHAKILEALAPSVQKTLNFSISKETPRAQPQPSIPQKASAAAKPNLDDIAAILGKK